MKSDYQKFMPKKLFSILLVLSAILMWSFSFPLIKIALDGGVPPITLSALRGLAFVPILLYLFLKNREDFLPENKNEWLVLIGISLFTIVIPNVLQNIGMMNTTASITSIIQSSGPVFTIILAIILLKESSNMYKIGGAVIALFATVLLTISTDDEFTFGGIAVFSNFLILLSSIAYSFSSVITKKGLSKIKPLKMLGFSSLIGFIILSFIVPIEKPINALSTLSSDIWFVVLLLILFPSFFAMLIWYEVMVHQEISSLVLFVYLMPVFSVIISVILIGETVSFRTIIFAACIIGGVIISQKDVIKSKKNN